MKSDIKKDLSTLTTINELTLSRLFDKVVWCICDAIEHMLLAKETTTEVDLVFGTLLIHVDNDEIKYKFKPSAKLEQAVTETVIDERNCLTCTLEDTLVSKITNTYKTFF